MQRGFVLESVHWAASPLHELCFERPAPFGSSSPEIFCVQCALSALTSASELRLSKTVLLSQTIKLLSDQGILKSILEVPEVLCGILSFAAVDSNFIGFGTCIEIREAILALFDSSLSLGIVLDLLLGNVFCALRQHSVSDIRWFFVLLERISQAMDLGGDQVALYSIWSTHTELVQHLIHSAYPSLADGDKIALLKLLEWSQYEPSIEQSEEHCFWLGSQLSLPTASPMLQVQILRHLHHTRDCMLPVLAKWIPNLNDLLLHETLEVGASATSLLCRLLHSDDQLLWNAIISSNSITFLVEFLLQVTSRSADEALEADLIEPSLDCLFLLFQETNDAFIPLIVDIVTILSVVFAGCQRCADKALELMESFASDTITQLHVPLDFLQAFVVDNISSSLNSPRKVRFMLDIARSIVNNVSNEVSLQLCNTLLLHQEAFFKILHNGVSRLTLDGNPSGEDLELELARSLFRFQVSICPIGPHLHQQFLDMHFMPFVFDSENRLVARPDWLFACLELLHLSIRPELFEWLSNALRNHLLSFLMRLDACIPAVTEIQALLVEILRVVDDGAHLADWQVALCYDRDDLHQKPWFQLRGGIALMDWMMPNSTLVSYIDLLHYSLLYSDFATVSYLVDTFMVFSSSIVAASWQQRLQFVISRIFKDFVVCALPLPQLVRVCHIWSHCSSFNSESSSLTNNTLVTALGGAKLEFSLLVSNTSYRNPQVAPPMPLSLLTWMFDHFHSGLMISNLHLLRDMIEKSDTNQLASTALFTHVSTNPKCLQVLVDTYSKNLVFKPIITPSQAIQTLHKFSTLSPLASSEHNRSDDLPPECLVGSNTCTSLLLSTSFPLEITKHATSQISVQDLEAHAIVIRQLAISELQQRQPSSGLVTKRSTDQRSALFSKYWRSVVSFTQVLRSLVLSRSTSYEEATLSHHLSFEELDRIGLQVLNLWNILLGLQPPAQLLARLVQTDTVGFLWRAFRVPTSSASSSPYQALGVVARFNAKRKCLAPLNDLSGDRFPPPPTSVLAAISLSVYLISVIERSSDDEDAVPSISGLLRCLQTSLMPNPTLQIISTKLCGKILVRIARRLLNEDHHNANSAHRDDSRLAFTCIASHYLSRIVTTDTQSIHATVCALATVEVVHGAPDDFLECWLKLPQVLHLFSTILDARTTLEPLSLVQSLFLKALITACTRLTPSKVPKRILGRLLTAGGRLLRKLLVSLTSPTIQGINMFTIYDLTRSNMLHSLIQREEPRSRVTLSQSLARSMSQLPPRGPEINTRNLFISIGSVIYPHSILQPDPELLEIFQTSKQVRIAQWLALRSAK